MYIIKASIISVHFILFKNIYRSQVVARILIKNYFKQKVINRPLQLNLYSINIINNVIVQRIPINQLPGYATSPITGCVCVCVWERGKSKSVLHTFIVSHHRLCLSRWWNEMFLEPSCAPRCMAHLFIKRWNLAAPTPDTGHRAPGTGHRVVSIKIVQEGEGQSQHPTGSSPTWPA